MSIRFAALLGALAVAGLLIAGCGDDDGADAGQGEVTVATSSLNKRQFVNRANKACFDVRVNLEDRIDAHKEEIDGQDQLLGTPDYQGLVDEVFLPTYAEEIAAVEALGAPAQEKANVEALLTTQRQALDEVAEQERIETFEPIERTFGEASRMMLDYGLSECAVSVPPADTRGQDPAG